MRFFGHFIAAQPTALGDWLTRKTVEKQFLFLRPRLSLGTKTTVLEIGPGKGEFAGLFFRDGFHSYDIIEPDDNLRALCAKLPIRNSFSGTIPPLPVSDNAYDLVIMCDVFEHMNDTRAAIEVLAEVRRVLKPGGLFFVLSPDYMHWKEDFFNCDFSHSNPTTVRRMNQMFFNLGFTTIATTYHYNFLSGIAGFLAGSLVRLATWPLAGFGSDNNSRIYRLRLCFLRRFLMIGQKS